LAPPPDPSTELLPGALSALLEEIARAPPVELEGGWDRLLRPGAVIGRFRLLREIGRGGFGVVYEAEDQELNRRIAFKAIRPGTAASGDRPEWLHREAEAVARLNHPSVVTLHDVGLCDSGPYLILELLKGEPLQARLARGPLPAPEALRIALAVAQGLAHAHREGVVHCDLTPGNVFLTEDGGVKILDFGLSRMLGRGSIVGGTRGFMAPEQWRGEAPDARTDVFSAGALLACMLTGAPPFPSAPGGAPPSYAGAPPTGAPEPIRAALAKVLVVDPAGRPQDGAALLALLSEAEAALRRRAGRSRRLLAAAALAALGAFAGALLFRAPPQRLRVAVAVADAENRTGDPRLDGLGGLLAAALEQSPRLRVISRSQLADRLGADRPARIDGAVARAAAARAEAQVLLLTVVRPAGAGYKLELHGADPASGEELFDGAGEAADAAAVPAALDALAARARQALHESEEEVRANGVPVARAVTGNLEAYQHYALGQECLDRPTSARSWLYPPVAECAAEFERALAADPDFPLAHFALALIEEIAAGDPRPHVEAALRHLDRIPARERELLRASEARLGGRVGEALARYGAVIDARPEDKQAVFLAGDLLQHRSEFASALPFLERAVELDPTLEWPLEHIAFDLGVLGRREQLRGWVRRWSQGRPGPAALHALSEAHGWLGEPGAAAADARRAAAAGILGADADLSRALLADDRLAEATALLEQVVARASDPSARWAHYQLAAALRAQGRPRAARAVLEALPQRFPDLRPDVVAGRIAELLVGERDPAAVRDACARANPVSANVCAIGLAYLGDVAGAAPYGARLERGSTAAELYQALAQWRAGDAEGALARLRAVERRQPAPWPLSLLAPSFLRGEICAAEGRDAEAVAALRAFEALYVSPLWRGWAIPRARLLAARSAERLGRPAEARAQARRLVAAFARAEPGQPEVAEARAIAARLLAPSVPDSGHAEPSP
jgi:tetratricopeptide (TPR) repeat protein